MKLWKLQDLDISYGDNKASCHRVKLHSAALPQPRSHFYYLELGST